MAYPATCGPLHYGSGARALNDLLNRAPRLLCLALGLVSATGFAPLGWWPLTIVAFALLMHLIAGADTFKAALGRGYWFGVGHFTLGLNWIAGAFRYQDAMPVWLGLIAVVGLSLYLAVYPALAAGLAWRWGRKHFLTFILFFAATWIVTEWLRATMFTGFAWNPLGLIMIDPHLGGGSQWVGTYGLSGLTLLAGGGVALLIVRQWRLALVALLAVILFAAPALYKEGGQASATQPAGRPPFIRILQPNISQKDKYDESFDAINFARLEEQMGHAGSVPRLILWPEAAIPDYIGEDWKESKNARARIASLIGPNDILLTGADKIFEAKRQVGVASESRWVGAANSVFALNGDGDVLWRYDKAHLVPGGEYLPLRWLMEPLGATRLVPGDLDFRPGPGPKSLEVPGFGKVGLQICYEIIFSGEVTDRTNRPAFIFNPSNEAWFGSWAQPQFLAQARLRAIEEGLPIVRSTPTGISAIIDANGHVLRSLPHGKPGFIESSLPPAHAPTLFSRFGNPLSLGFAALLALLGIAIRRRSR